MPTTRSTRASTPSVSSAKIETKAKTKTTTTAKSKKSETPATSVRSTRTSSKKRSVPQDETNDDDQQVEEGNNDTIESPTVKKIKTGPKMSSRALQMSEMARSKGKSSSGEDPLASLVSPAASSKKSNEEKAKMSATSLKKLMAQEKQQLMKPVETQSIVVLDKSKKSASSKDKEAPKSPSSILASPMKRKRGDEKKKVVFDPSKDEIKVLEKNNETKSLGDSMDVDNEPDDENRLPPKYQELEDIYIALEVAFGFLEGRRIICTIEKLQEALVSMSQRSLSLAHLGKIKTIFPEGFLFKILRQSVIVIRVPASGMSNTSSPHNAKNEIMQDKNEEFSSLITSEVELQRRRSEFHERLLRRFKQEQSKFYSKNKRSKRFPIDELDIEVSDLPKPPPPVEDSAKLAKKELLKSLLESPKKSPIKSTLVTPVTKVSKELNPETVNRVRLKEQALKEDNGRSVESLRRKTNLGRLPSLCDNLRSFFSVESRSVLPLPALLEKLSVSYSAKYTKDELRQVIDLLLEVVPSWCSIENTKSGEVVRLDKKTSFGEVKNSIRKAIQLMA